MPTQYLTFKGKVKWCRPRSINEWGKYNTRFYPDAESKTKLKELQIKNEWKTDPDGDFVNISAFATRDFKGQKIMQTVKVTDAHGQPLDADIGDNSDVIMSCEYYDYAQKNSPKRGHALKWTGLQVLELVPVAREYQEATIRF